MIFMGLSYTDMSNLFPNLCLAFESFTLFSPQAIQVRGCGPHRILFLSETLALRHSTQWKTFKDNCRAQTGKTWRFQGANGVE